MGRWSSVLVAMAVLLLSGWVHGKWSGRWQESHLLADAVARVDQVPSVVGPWQATNLETDQDAFQRAGALGYWMRQYQHARSPKSLQVILMCGKSNRMAVHTPEVCYKGAGFELVGFPALWVEKEIASEWEKSNTLWTALFHKKEEIAKLRLYWGWNSTGSWQAPDNPRWEFQGKPFLYKLYVSQELTGSQTFSAQEFLEEFLPVLKQTLLVAEL